MLCVITSLSSIAILLVLLGSILWRGLPVFFAPTDPFSKTVDQLDEQVVLLQSQHHSAAPARQPELKSQIAAAEKELTAAKSKLAKVVGPFITKSPSPNANEAGIGPALMGSLWVCAGCAIFFLPLGVGTAIFLEEFKPRNVLLRHVSGILQINISNLAGVPSIVYGILGLTVFASMFGYFGSTAEPYLELGSTFKRQYVTEGLEVVFLAVNDRNTIPELVDGMTAQDGDGNPVNLVILGTDDDFPENDATLKRTLLPDAEGGVVVNHAWYSFRLPFGRSVLTASLTLMLVILPVVIIASQESLRAVPSSLRQAAFGLGCTPWQVVRNVTLPAAIPGIMTGSILAMSRAIGEAAPILMIAGIVRITSGPQHLMDDFSILPLQIYYWAGLPVEPDAPLNFQHVASAGIIVLLIVLFAFNSVAVLIRYLAQRNLD